MPWERTRIPVEMRNLAYERSLRQEALTIAHLHTTAVVARTPRQINKHQQTHTHTHKHTESCTTNDQCHKLSLGLPVSLPAHGNLRSQTHGRTDTCTHTHAQTHPHTHTYTRPTNGNKVTATTAILARERELKHACAHPQRHTHTNTSTGIHAHATHTPTTTHAQMHASHVQAALQSPGEHTTQACTNA